MARLARLVPLVPIALTLFVSAPAQASPLIEAFGAVGGNAGEQGVVSGTRMRRRPTSIRRCWSTPSDELQLGFALMSEQLGVTLEGRLPGADVPLVVGNRGVTFNGQPLPPDVVPDAVAQCTASPAASRRVRASRRDRAGRRARTSRSAS